MRNVQPSFVPGELFSLTDKRGRRIIVHIHEIDQNISQK